MRKTAQPEPVDLVPVSNPESDAVPTAEVKSRTIPFPSWHFWGILLIMFSGGVGFMATSVLLNLNGVDNCNALYMPLTSATTRLYCAQIEADKQTVESLLKAIRMVEKLPQDNALRTDIDRKIEVWVTDIIDLAEEKYQAGELDEAIEIVEQIPSKVAAYSLVTERIKVWQTLWAEGESIYSQVQDSLSQGNIEEALQAAVQLSYLDNQYWSMVRYDEAINQIQLTRKENSELDAAIAASERGGIEAWLQTIEQAENISEDSFAYKQAQKLIEEAQGNIINYIQGVIDQRRWDELLSLSDRLSNRVKFESMVMDWKILARAGLNAQKGNIANLESALVQIQSIRPSSPVYDQSQRLAGRWEKEISDVAIIEQGKNIALGGTVSQLQQAIEKLRSIPSGNPRYGEAQKTIAQWRRQIEVVEDEPTLDYAKDLAASNRLSSLQEAITQARKIRPGRALYSEAQENIRTWQTAIQRIEDQPIYDRAVELGQQKKYLEAIATADQISAGRALYGDIQQKVRTWQQELDAITKLEQAYDAAANNSAQGLSQAIKLAQSIPSGASQLRSEGTQAANRWSYSLLEIAEGQASSSLNQAIATARLVPSNTAAYNAAQAQIAAWQQQLAPLPEFEPPSIEVEVLTPQPQN